ncbi:MAG: UDP-N-acetylmuramate dehydrogenase [Candidatus Omnitrophica bacterium]|nr:UDP-N-acetylmuramate dehydrogenase [Candidatus Omnitrophota bacterium]MCM8830937.1 UDP-N-acetylmuramate dehydrogenase [Candidatus Omnitrophota bacterium]
MNLKEVELKQKVSLKNYTTIRIGGEAKNFFIVRSVEGIKSILEKFSNSFYILGKGSNILVKDTLIKKPIIKLSDNFDYIKKNGNFFEVGAATSLSKLLKFCIKNKLSGLENLAGIPATVGGLIFMNASAFGREISTFLEAIEIVDEYRNLKKLTKNEIRFFYRGCSLKNSIILRAWFKFLNVENLKDKIKYFLVKRYLTQDLSFPSCGCIFKNPPSYSAGFLIEACGLKGFRKNDAQISLKHANFIINLGKAKYRDVDYLIKIAKEEVYKKFGIILEEEIKRWY